MGKVIGRCPPHEWVVTPSGRRVCLWCEVPFRSERPSGESERPCGESTPTVP